MIKYACFMSGVLIGMLLANAMDAWKQSDRRRHELPPVVAVEESIPPPMPYAPGGRGDPASSPPG